MLTHKRNVIVLSPRVEGFYTFVSLMRKIPISLQPVPNLSLLDALKFLFLDLSVYSLMFIA